MHVLRATLSTARGSCWKCALKRLALLTAIGLTSIQVGMGGASHSTDHEEATCQDCKLS